MKAKRNGPGCGIGIIFGIAWIILTLYSSFNFFHEFKERLLVSFLSLIFLSRFVLPIQNIVFGYEDFRDNIFERKWYNVTTFSYIIIFNSIFLIGALSIPLTLFNRMYSFTNKKILDIGLFLLIYGIFGLLLDLSTCFSNMGYEVDVGDGDYSQNTKLELGFLLDIPIIIILYFLNWGFNVFFMLIIGIISLLIIIWKIFIKKYLVLIDNNKLRLSLFFTIIFLVIIGFVFLIPIAYYNLLR